MISFKSIVLIIFSFLFLLVTHLTCVAASQRIDSYIVADANTGKILLKKNANTECYPASLTKMMTLYLLFKALKSGKINFNTKFKVSKFAESQIKSKLNLKHGELVTVRLVINSLIVKSANDSAVVAAEGLCGSVGKFVKLMNKTAEDLGMKRTNFCNSSGIYHKDQKTTARDMAILAKALLTDFPEFSSLFKMTSFSYQGKTYNTTNSLLRNFKGTNGMKTGYIFNAGYNISTSVIRYNDQGKPIHLLAVVMGQDSKQAREKKVIRLLEPIFLNQKAFFYAANNSTLGENPSSKKNKKTAPIFFRAPLHYTGNLKLLLEQYGIKNPAASVHATRLQKKITDVFIKLKNK